MFDFMFGIFAMLFPFLPIVSIILSIYIAIQNNKLGKRFYGLFFPVIITICNIWLFPIDRTDMFHDALRFYFFLIDFCLPMLISSTIYHSIRLHYLYKSIKWRVFPISICYLFGLIFHYLNTMHWEELFRGKKFVFDILLISTAIISYLPCLYLYILQRRKNNP